MRKSYWLVFALALLLTAGSVLASEPIDRPLKNMTIENYSPVGLDETVQVWVEDFESGIDSWTYFDGLANDVTYWSTDDAPTAHGGDYVWHCYDPDATEEPLYGSDWFQWLKTPNLAANLTSSPEMSFWFRLHCEGDNWDGATVWVFYGTDETTHDYAVLTPATGPAYTGDVNGFSYFEDGSGWSSNTAFLTWQEVTVDLSAYTAYDYVRVAFIFASDGNTEEGFGFMVDDIVLNDGGSDVWSDDAEDEANSDMEAGVGAGVAGVPNLFALATNDTFPSPTHAFGIDQQELGFYQIYESSTFDFPTLQAGEDMQFNTQICASMFYEANHTRPDWQFHVWDPEEEQWWYGSNIRDISGSNYVYVGGTQNEGWSDFTTGFGTDWAIPEDMSGLTGVKVRIAVSVPRTPDPGDEDGFFNWVLWDDIELLKNTLEHDIGTVLYIPYPTTVNIEVPGMVTYTNYGVNDETGVIALWGIGETPSMPVSFGGTTVNPNFDITVGSMVDGYISNDGIVEYWTPTGPGATTLSAGHSLAGDQIPDNDIALIDIEVMDEGTYELGYDSRDFTGSLTVDFAQNDGVLYHYVPEAVNEMFAEGTWNITGLNGDFYFHNALGGFPAGGCELGLHFYGSGADAPGDLLYETVYAIEGIETGAFGWWSLDYAVEDAALTNLDDFWVWIEFLDFSANDNTYICPFPGVTASVPDNQQYMYRYDGTTVTAETEQQWHVTVEVEAYNDVEVVDNNVPATFALNNAYPNPFNPSTTLSFDVANSSLVSLKVYNLMGQEVATLVNTNMIAGSYQTSFDASALSSGVYFVRMEAAGFNAVQKIMLMK